MLLRSKSAPGTAAWPPSGVRDRLELAVAYLDLGDKETARSLLREVVVTGDDVARAEAAALLNQIV